MRRGSLFAALTLLVMRCAATSAAAHAEARQTSLCDALASIGDGERRIVTITGVYIVGPEHQIFYDPNELTCRRDVQPETWVEFANDAVSNELNEIMRDRRPFEETRRAQVTFTGELHGPGAVRPDDPSLSPLIAFANRIRDRRYGHLNGFRTKFVVKDVTNVRSVPASSPWPARRPTREVTVVERAEVPRYPEMAWNAGISGDVVLQVTVTGGEVSNVIVTSGDRMLAPEAVQNVKTWKFTPSTTSTFVSTFSFNLEMRDTAASKAPRIELELPGRVRITAARNGW